MFFTVSCSLRSPDYIQEGRGANYSHPLLKVRYRRTGRATILIKKSLSCDVLDTVGDEEDNFLVLKARFLNQTVILVSIYGPNNRDDDFFIRLTASIRAVGDFPIIMGGDWNTVFSCLPLAGNIDVLNMSALPNPSNSKK